MIMGEVSAENVFKPGCFSRYTYVCRQAPLIEETYEDKLEQDLKVSGCLISIVGPSKSGKTLLCEKVIENNRLIEVSGIDFDEDNNLWKVILKKLNFTSEKWSKDNIINYFKENNLVLLLDDFHYASKAIQLNIARQLKYALNKELKVIIISLPLLTDEAIRKNVDLIGRLILINVEPWKEKELQCIAINGYKKLGMDISQKYISNIATESLTSPQLMQSICLNLYFLIVNSNIKNVDVGDKLLEKAYKRTTLNFEYKDVIKVLREGIRSRLNTRETYMISGGKFLNSNELIVNAIALNPPKMIMTVDELFLRVDSIIIDEKKIIKSEIEITLDKIVEMLKVEDPLYQVISYDGINVEILDPLFLFYLRWSGV